MEQAQSTSTPPGSASAIAENQGADRNEDGNRPNIDEQPIRNNSSNSSSTGENNGRDQSQRPVSSNTADQNDAPQPSVEKNQGSHHTSPWTSVKSPTVPVEIPLVNLFGDQQAIPLSLTPIEIVPTPTSSPFGSPLPSPVGSFNLPPPPHAGNTLSAEPSASPVSAESQDTPTVPVPQPFFSVSIVDQSGQNHHANLIPPESMMEEFDIDGQGLDGLMHGMIHDNDSVLIGNFVFHMHQERHDLECKHKGMQKLNMEQLIRKRQVIKFNKSTHSFNSEDSDFQAMRGEGPAGFLKRMYNTLVADKPLETLQWSCPICHENLKENKKTVVITPCLHMFCLTCAFRWFPISTDCPMCRKKTCTCDLWPINLFSIPYSMPQENKPVHMQSDLTQQQMTGEDEDKDNNEDKDEDESENKDEDENENKEEDEDENEDMGEDDVIQAKKTEL